MIAQLVGLLTGLALLCFFVENDLRRAHREALWLASLRERYRQTKPRLPALDRLAHEMKEAGVSGIRLIITAALAFVVLSVLVSLAEESVVFGVLVSLAGTIGGSVSWIRYRYHRRKRAFFDALLREAMPMAITTLRATNRLEAAFEDVASIARDKRVKEEFETLAKTWRGLQVTPEQALGLAASRWEIEEMVQLAKATEEAVKYDANLAELWLRYREQIERDEDKRRKLRAKTLAGRRNGLIYSGIVVAMFGLAYPRAHPYMTSIANVGFWVVLLILLACTWAIWRAGEVIEV